MPTTTMKAIKELINKDKAIEIEDSSIIIKEKGKEASLKQISIIAVGADSLGIRYEQLGHAGKSFSDGHPVYKACDVILFCVKGGKGNIIFIEMKSGMPSKNEYIPQLASADCFVNYVNSIINVFHRCDCAPWNRYFYVFHDIHRSINKRRTVAKNILNDKPETAAILPVMNKEKIYLKKLLS